MNKDCTNYKLAMEDDVEICPACNKPTTKIVSKVNNQLAIAAVVTSVVALLIYWFFGFGFGDFGVGMYVAFALALASIVVGFISKSIAAIIIAFAVPALMLGLILSWM